MDDAILRKIKRCLALTKSSNPNEAATALRQAQAMMAKHGITREDVAVADVSTRTSKTSTGKTPPRYLVMLINLVTDAFGSEVVYNQIHNGERWTAEVEFLGVDGAAEVSAYAFDVIGRQLRRDRTDYLNTLSKRIKRSTRTARGDLYCEGWLTAIKAQVVKQQQPDAHSQAIQAYKAKLYQELATTEGKASNASRRDWSALAKGLEDGSKAQFYQGVNGTRQQRIGS